ncbi:MAG: DUF6476 family protein, partial [Pseudomonadota bacterium]
MAEDPQNTGNELNEADARNLRFLRSLVTVLTASMIVGVLAIVVLLVIRLNQSPALLAIPAQIALPDGTRAVAVTQTATNILVVTETQTLLIFNQSGSELLRTIQLGDVLKDG